jgi:L-amino acid N-acyltransferase YncA
MGIVIRRARLQDASSIARIHVETWLATYRGMVPEEVLDALSVAEREKLWRHTLATDEARLVFVAEDDHALTGFCSAHAPARGTDASERIAEIRAIYVSPRWWRSGVGRALIEVAVAELGAEGWRSVQLWVLAGNEGAKRFYERLGFKADGTEKLDTRLGATELRMGASLQAR